MNTASAQAFEESKAVVISTNRCFTVRCLKFYATWLQKKTFGNKNEEKGYGGDHCELHRQLHADALMYCLSMPEFSCVRQRLAIVIGEEISEETLEKHDSYLHGHVLPVKWAKAPLVFVGDGHEKVLAKCSAGQEQYSRVRKINGTSNPFTNGCDMIVTEGHIVAVEQQIRSENNENAEKTLEKAVRGTPGCDRFCYDWNCKFSGGAKKNRIFTIITHWAIDKVHASRGHKKDWPCNPNRVSALKRRLKKMNIIICEQTFSCFRHYARVINEMKPTRHRILVLYYSKIHNE